MADVAGVLVVLQGGSDMMQAMASRDLHHGRVRKNRASAPEALRFCAKEFFRLCGRGMCTCVRGPHTTGAVRSTTVVAVPTALATLPKWRFPRKVAKGNYSEESLPFS